MTGEYPEDFQHCSQDRHGKDHCCDGSIVWPRDTEAARMPGEQSVLCFMTSGLTLDLVMAID